MEYTLLTRISKLEQYNPRDKCVLWDDPTDNRWKNIYGKLKINDNAIFISKGKLLIGIITKINFGQSLFCSEIQEIICSNDQFLQLHEIYPELVSRIKANFQPFIHPQQVNIKQLINDANAKRFISYYIVSNKNKYDELTPIFNINDRIVIVNSNNEIENVKLHTTTDLIPFPISLNVTISVLGLTLNEILEKNKSMKRESNKSNNIKRIQDIIKSNTENGFFKFKTFFSYYDCLYNKKVYRDTFPQDNSIVKINLKTDETIFKISMSSKSINENAFKNFNDQKLIVVHSNTKAKGTFNQTQGDTFSKQMKIGDYFYLCRGNSNLEVIGKVTSNAEECKYNNLGDKGWLQRSYEIIEVVKKMGSYQDEKKWWTPNDNSTCIAIPKDEIDIANNKIFIPFFNSQFDYENIIQINTQENKSNDSMYSTLNQILFGAPGTGKTYNTKRIAVEIINGIKQRTREDINKEYEDLVNAKQIVFTTFHQSLSYEDFIEGIKPETSDGSIIYKVKNGIFKSFCLNANPKNTIDFEKAYEKLQNNLVENETIELTTPKDKKFLISLNKNANLSLITGSNEEKQGVLTKERLLRQLNGEDVFIGWEGYYKGVIKYLESEFNFNPDATERDKNYVLIIDEINRGNVSAIFGELITLLEEDKRKGNKEQIEVTLPYSNDKFSVPNNVHIIGTMNTADRSVEALDTALRRRFSFTEMRADSNILPDSDWTKIDLKCLLSTINQRLEVLIDKDHQIGHSYFMGIKNLKDLKHTFKDKIIPLLEEYFFGDFGKIGMILGGSFIFQENTKAKFPKNFEYENDFLEDKKVYHFTSSETWDESTFIAVYED